jgi:hypothetical protein
VAVKEVEDLVKEDEGRTSRCLEEASDGLCPRRCRLGCWSKHGYADVPSELPRQVYPGCLIALLGVPSVADKDTHASLRYCRKVGIL